MVRAFSRFLLVVVCLACLVAGAGCGLVKRFRDSIGGGGAETIAPSEELLTPLHLPKATDDISDKPKPK